MDEISTEGSNLIFSNKFGESNFDPKDLKISKLRFNELKGKNPEYNASRIREIFTGKKDSFYDLVCVNAAFAFLLDAAKEPNQKNIIEYYVNSSKCLHKFYFSPRRSVWGELEMQELNSTSRFGSRNVLSWSSGKFLFL